MEDTPFQSPYIPNTNGDRQQMLAAIGVSSSDELFLDIPKQFRNSTLKLPAPLSELALLNDLRDLASENAIPGTYSCFLGAGAYCHFIPSIVQAIASRGEYLTAYTPYQPEVSQGTLQVTYEFQSLICLLTGMEVANAGMYDGATAMAEAALMASRITHRNRVVALDTVSPRYHQVLQTYTKSQGIEVLSISRENARADKQTACIIVQQPNFLGELEDLTTLEKLTHQSGALLVIATSTPIAFGMLKPPADYGADVVTGECQSLGIPLSFGGPYAGFFACHEQFLRQMPGRIVGKTTDTRGQTGYVLTLQTREQHIRREQATSNICTSQSLVALMATTYLASLGKYGLRQVAELCYHKAHYAAFRISELPGYRLPIKGHFFHEFVIECPLPPSIINERLLAQGIIGGLDVSNQVRNGMLLCVTEMNAKEQIDRMVNVLATIGEAL